MVDTTILAFVLLFLKHFIIDFPMQMKYQYLNKGTYGHPGGILHAALHIVGSMVVLYPVIGYTALVTIVCAIEGIVHYHIDWAKMNINRIKGWKCNTHEEFWILTGFDQLLHYLTYASMVYVLV